MGNVFNAPTREVLHEVARINRGARYAGLLEVLSDGVLVYRMHVSHFIVPIPATDELTVELDRMRVLAVRELADAGQGAGEVLA